MSKNTETGVRWVVELNYNNPGWCHESKEWYFSDDERPNNAVVGDEVELHLSSVRPVLDEEGRIMIPPEAAAEAVYIIVKAKVFSRVEFNDLDGSVKGYRLMLHGAYEGRDYTIELRATVIPSVMNGVIFLLR